MVFFLSFCMTTAKNEEEKPHKPTPFLAQEMQATSKRAVSWRRQSKWQPTVDLRTGVYLTTNYIRTFSHTYFHTLTRSHHHPGVKSTRSRHPFPAGTSLCSPERLSKKLCQFMQCFCLQIPALDVSGLVRASPSIHLLTVLWSPGSSPTFRIFSQDLHHLLSRPPSFYWDHFFVENPSFHH